MIGMHYGTASVPRSEVLPGTMLQHHGKTYRASANVEKGLYAFNIFEKTIIKSDSVVVLLNERGEPMVHRYQPPYSTDRPGFLRAGSAHPNFRRNHERSNGFSRH